MKSNKAVKPFACGSLGRSALRTCSGMASPFLPEHSLHTERRLPWRCADLVVRIGGMSFGFIRAGQGVRMRHSGRKVVRRLAKGWAA